MNSVSQKSALAALRGSQECVQDMMAEYAHRRDLLINCFNETALISCRKSAGTFYAFPNVTKTGHDSKTVTHRLLTQSKVATVPDVAFGKSGEGHIRICFATDIENIREALRRIAHYFKEITQTTVN